jgi:hypothetical protein
VQKTIAQGTTFLTALPKRESPHVDS